MLPRCRGGVDRERPTDGERSVCVLYCLRERDLREWIYVESGRAAAACGRGHGDAEPGRRVRVMIPREAGHAIQVKPGVGTTDRLPDGPASGLLFGIGRAFLWRLFLRWQ